MSEYMFGMRRGQKLSTREVRMRDRICREEGGYGYTQYDESHGTGSGRWVGWFSGPNQGEPFDRDLSRRVLDRVNGAAKRRNA